MHPVLAHPSDAEALARVHIRSWRDAYAHILDPAYLAGLSIDARAARWQEILAKNDSETLVVRDADAVLGFVSHGACRDAGAAPTRGEIWALYVDPAAWGRRVGTTLVREVVERQRAAGRTELSLWVLALNDRGIGFYASVGFGRVHGSEQFFELGGRQVQEVRYVLPLGG